MAPLFAQCAPRRKSAAKTERDTVPHAGFLGKKPHGAGIFRKKAAKHFRHTKLIFCGNAAIGSSHNPAAPPKGRPSRSGRRPSKMVRGLGAKKGAEPKRTTRTRGVDPFAATPQSYRYRRPDAMKSRHCRALCTHDNEAARSRQRRCKARARGWSPAMSCTARASASGDSSSAMIASSP